MAKTNFAQKTTGELLEIAAKWDADRRVRACEQLSNYKLLAGGKLVNITTGEVREAEDAARWAELPGVAVFTGCDCEDEENRLRLLRGELKQRGVAVFCHCKHTYARVLLCGHTLAVRCPDGRIAKVRATKKMLNRK